MSFGDVGFPVSPADSARVAAHVYSVSLLACLPLGIAGVGAMACRNASPQSRALIWRSAIIALLVVYCGRVLPIHWLAWSLPGNLAAPLVTLGRLQLSASDHGASAVTGAGGLPDAALVSVLLLAYWSGVVVLLIPIVRTLLSGSRIARRARPLVDDSWFVLLTRARAEVGVRQQVQLLVTDEAVAPQTWGLFRFTILLPREALRWTEGQRNAVLLHELTHVRRRDPLFLLAARLACALYWFHPGAWWAAHALSNENELSCDARVLRAGVRRSDYAELLLLASEVVGRPRSYAPTSAAIVGQSGLRARLVAIMEPPRRGHSVSRVVAAAVVVFTLTTAVPVSSVQLAPSRQALTTLMSDTRWESRAYAVAGLAQRRDSVEVARAAANLDPSPRVRALARFALAQPSGRDLPAILSEQH